MKRIYSSVVAMMMAFVLSFVSVAVVNAAETDTPVIEGPIDEYPVNGNITWSSGTFILDATQTADTKNFNGGSIYVAFNSSNSWYSGNYTVQLRKVNYFLNIVVGYTDYTSIPISANGVSSCTWTNMPSGNYVLKFTPGDSTSAQSYTVISAYSY